MDYPKDPSECPGSVYAVMFLLNCAVSGEDAPDRSIRRA